ncbi:uncharacterized protein LOC120836829 [Ixodes scapularis]|uniref:uncharacterized protein LOC120836829 n=1 Tax=Ixodes scapularis TaxID=6945 RepID=UPI001A9EE0CA|nr:uncharacterized protein LOC120836829 [Ixodes scapularis]
MDRIVPLVLQASARSWLGLQAPFTSQTRLREEFLPVDYATQILRELEARPQHLDESQDRYVQVMQELFKRADPNTPESDRVARVRRLCHPRYHACLIEEALHAERNYVLPPPAKYALKPACPEASTEVDCSNETSPPHHINRESWRDMYGVRLTLIERSLEVTAVPVRISGGGRHDRWEVVGRALSQVGAQRRSLPKRTICISVLLQVLGKTGTLRSKSRSKAALTPAATEQALPTTANHKPGRGLPIVVLYQITGGGHLGVGDLSRQLLSDCCYRCEQPDHQRN